MRFFRKEIETTLKMLGVIALIGFIVLPVAWGYDQRRQALTWQNIVCAYRIREVASRTPFIAVADVGRNACGTLKHLGLDLTRPN